MDALKRHSPLLFVPIFFMVKPDCRAAIGGDGWTRDERISRGRREIADCVNVHDEIWKTGENTVAAPLI